MRRSTLYSLVLIAAVMSLVALQAWAYPEFARKTKAACASCHVSPAGGAGLNDAGKAYQADASKAPAASAGIEYVGNNKCKMCHMKQHKAWGGTKHASAMKNLAAANEKTVAEMAEKLKVELKGPAAKDDACVPCHVTGWKLAGGYPAADSTKNASLAMVGCEACHGPGAKHVAAALADKKKFITKNLTEKMCLTCHKAAVSPNFKFDVYKTKVHPVATVAK